MVYIYWNKHTPHCLIIGSTRFIPPINPWKICIDLRIFFKIFERLKKIKRNLKEIYRLSQHFCTPLYILKTSLSPGDLSTFTYPLASLELHAHFQLAKDVHKIKGAHLFTRLGNKRILEELEPRICKRNSILPKSFYMYIFLNLQ